MKNKTILLQVMILIMISAIFISIVKTQHENVSAAISRYGSTGSEVTQIQKKLKSWGYYSGAVDGIYGSQTKAAVEYFQRKNGLTVDGIAGSQTLKAMGIMTSANTTTSSTYNQNNRNLLARVINGEARGEPFTGQVAVGAVVMNRVSHPSFPNSIAGVVYQPGAFTAIQDGQINAEMEQSSYRAADMALSGADPTGGAIYYYNPKTATNEWIRSRPVLKVIGNHVFTK